MTEANTSEVRAHTLTGQMSGPMGLRVLAQWLDESPRFADMEGTEVQDDLRRWADDMENAAEVVAAALDLWDVELPDGSKVGDCRNFPNDSHNCYEEPLEGWAVRLDLPCLQCALRRCSSDRTSAILAQEAGDV